MGEHQLHDQDLRRVGRKKAAIREASAGSHLETVSPKATDFMRTTSHSCICSWSADLQIRAS